MDFAEFKNDFLQDIKAAAAATGEGSCAAFVENVAQYLIDAEVLSDFSPSFYIGRYRRSKYRVDGYVFDEFDNTMNLIIANYDGNDLDRTLTNTEAKHDFGELTVFLDAALKSDLYQEIEISTPCADLVDFLRINKNNIRKYRLLIFTDADMSMAIKTVEIDDYEGIPVEGQIWDIGRLYHVCCSELGRQLIEINFTDYCEEGIPCIEASSAANDKYRSYLGVIPGSVLADIYDKYGSKLLEGNVRSFLTTKVAVNKKIRATILNAPQMFFAFNNGIAATAMGIVIKNTNHGRFITFARDFQIINGGQTTASISTARYNEKKEGKVLSLEGLYVQMKLTDIEESTPEEADELIRNISRSSNEQNKVSDADFFASHPFHRRMEQISRRLFAPAVDGSQHDTKWFYERARGQYLQAQMRMTNPQKKQFERQHPKKQVIKKTDLAKVQNTWMGHPDIVSKGAQTNFKDFANYIEEQWSNKEEQFNDLYFKSTVALLLMFQYLEKTIPGQQWYEGGYRANIICYTIALFRHLIQKQFPDMDLDLMIIWNRQALPEPVKYSLLNLAEKVLVNLTDKDRPVANVTQWCKRKDCWTAVKRIYYALPSDLLNCLISSGEKKDADRNAGKEQKVINGIHAQTEVISYPPEMWERLENFASQNHLLKRSTDKSDLDVACGIPNKIPTEYQSIRLLDLLRRAVEEGFNKSE